MVISKGINKKVCESCRKVCEGCESFKFAKKETSGSRTAAPPPDFSLVTFSDDSGGTWSCFPYTFSRPCQCGETYLLAGGINPSSRCILSMLR